MELEPRDRSLLRDARVAHLATTDARRRPHVVPICFAFDGERFYTAVDDKPKDAAPRRLKRVRNVQENPSVALLVDLYHEDWDRLGYVLVHGKAALVEEPEERRRAAELLKAKYAQYAEVDLNRPDRVLLRVEPRRVHGWWASPPGP